MDEMKTAKKKSSKKASTKKKVVRKKATSTSKKAKKVSKKASVPKTKTLKKASSKKAVVMKDPVLTKSTAVQSQRPRSQKAQPDSKVQNFKNQFKSFIGKINWKKAATVAFVAFLILGNKGALGPTAQLVAKSIVGANSVFG